MLQQLLLWWSTIRSITTISVKPTLFQPTNAQSTRTNTRFERRPNNVSTQLNKYYPFNVINSFFLIIVFVVVIIVIIIIVELSIGSMMNQTKHKSKHIKFNENFLLMSSHINAQANLNEFTQSNYENQMTNANRLDCMSPFQKHQLHKL